MDPVVADLAAQHRELAGLLDGLAEAGWRAQTRCEGWDVADVVLHLAQTDQMAVGSATGRFESVVAEMVGGSPRQASVDDGAAMLVALERGLPDGQLLARWSAGASRLIDVLDAMDLSTRVTWVAGDLSARSLATTRLAESWIHTGDVADALGVTLEPTDRLRQIARLAWRTLPYAFASEGLTMAGPVRFRLTAPGGGGWVFEPDEPAVTTITGPAVELCAVAARRVDPSATSLEAVGPDASHVLALVRTYAR
jgi:uncharacterized protein (TIGR03084 family)